jgi:hypothetical protein
MIKIYSKTKGHPHNRPQGPRVPGRLSPGFLDVLHYKGGRSPASRTDRLHIQDKSWYSLLEAESTLGHMVPSVATEKIPSVTHRESIPRLSD